MKKCRTCERLLELSEFNKDASQRDGLSAKCRECAKSYNRSRNEYYREYRRKQKEDDRPAIYKILCPEGYVYFGFTTAMEHRIRAHRSRITTKTHSNPTILELSKRYTADDFRFEVIRYCEEMTQDEIEALEMYLINNHDCCNAIKGYDWRGAE